MPNPIQASVLAALLVAPAAFGATPPSLTIYPATGNALFSGNSRDVQDVGHALVHEQRELALAAGNQHVRIGGLPTTIDPEAIAVGFGAGPAVSVTGQRVELGGNGGGAVGRQVTLHGIGGRGSLTGELVMATPNGQLIRTADGTLHMVHQYASMTMPADAYSHGSTLLLDIDAHGAGRREALLTYVTSGLGWRAAYAVTLTGDAGCRMRFKPEASVANRSGRAYRDAAVTLVAGQPNLGNPGIRMFSVAAPRAPAPAEAAARAMPAQAALGDYRSFTLPGAVNLPNDTVTLTPLYRPREMACARQYIVSDGNTFSPPHPNTNDYGAQDYKDRAVPSTLTFTAPEALPAGTLRAWTADAAGGPALLGEGAVANTPKGQKVSVQLGRGFNLRASRERTAFKVDAKAHTLVESYRMVLSNAGSGARSVTLREHPDRWREWTLTASSRKPSKQTPQLLEFKVPVGPHGTATVTYTVRYQWSAQDLQ